MSVGKFYFRLAELCHIFWTMLQSLSELRYVVTNCLSPHSWCLYAKYAKINWFVLGYGECASVECESSESTNDKGLHRLLTSKPNLRIYTYVYIGYTNCVIAVMADGLTPNSPRSSVKTVLTPKFYVSFIVSPTTNDFVKADNIIQNGW